MKAHNTLAMKARNTLKPRSGFAKWLRLCQCCRAMRSGFAGHPSSEKKRCSNETGELSSNSVTIHVHIFFSQGFIFRVCVIWRPRRCTMTIKSAPQSIRKGLDSQRCGSYSARHRSNIRWSSPHPCRLPPPLPAHDLLRKLGSFSTQNHLDRVLINSCLM